MTESLQVAKQQKRVLIVDDPPTMRERLYRVMEKEADLLAERRCRQTAGANVFGGQSQIKSMSAFAAETSDAIEVGTVLTDGSEKQGQILGASAPLTGGAGRLDDGAVTERAAKPGNSGKECVALTPLQKIIQEVLDPVALDYRPVKEWRSLYKAFFGCFAPDGSADPTERKAWVIAAEVFNTNLIAASNRAIQIVPMTFQDFVDGVDSFRHDGLREGARRDIAFQPKKLLALMAALIGRIFAGWQADLRFAPALRQDPDNFRNHVIAENRRASFLRFVVDYDPRFSILEYRAAGLKPLLQAFPHVAYALVENGICRCQMRAVRAAEHAPVLQAQFARPLRVPTQLQTLSRLDLVLLHQSVPLSPGSRAADSTNSYIESSRAAYEALVFEPSESPESKCAKIERLFELALTDGLLACGPQRADTSTAARIAAILGRTQAEQFVIERFFALGFTNLWRPDKLIRHRTDKVVHWASTDRGGSFFPGSRVLFPSS